MIRIAVFASGAGSNAEKLICYFKNHEYAGIQLVVSNNSKAGVLSRAKSLDVETVVLTKDETRNGNELLQILRVNKIDFIVLAGYLFLIPEIIIDAYQKRIINLHPALLPDHGGKGFYGSAVHESVLKLKSIMSGITIHHVNNKFDEGEIIFQAACHVDKNDTADSLAEKIHTLEHSYLPVVVEKLVKNLH
jgi:phosphoribosylglycinamide formyltransferase-1